MSGKNDVKNQRRQCKATAAGCSYLVIVIFMCGVLADSSEAWVQRGKNGRIDSILNDFDDEDLRFNDYENRLEDSFFKYVARTDDYDRNEVPWESGDKPVQVKMSAYLRQVTLY